MKKDLEDFDIKLSFEQIKAMKKNKFKQIVKEACKSYSFKKLLTEKAKHKKGSKLTYNKLKIQKYLITDKISTKEAKLLFKVRTEMIEVKQNYKNKYTKKSNEPLENEEALLCPLCHDHVDNAENVFKCSTLSINNENDQSKHFNNLFSNNMNTVATAIKQFSYLWRIRQQKLEKTKK